MTQQFVEGTGCRVVELKFLFEILAHLSGFVLVGHLDTDDRVFGNSHINVEKALGTRILIQGRILFCNFGSLFE